MSLPRVLRKPLLTKTVEVSVCEILGLIGKDSTNETNIKFPFIILGNQMKPKINKCTCRSNMAL